MEALREQGIVPRALVRNSSNVERLTSLGVEQVRGSFADAGSLVRAMAGVDVVLHLAAATRARSEAEYRRANVEAPAAVVEAIRRTGGGPRRLVYMSSMAAAGPSRAGRPVAEEDPPRPVTVYGRSKLAGERVVRDAAGDFEVVVIRAPAVYGPRDRDLLIYFRLARLGIVPLPTGPERRVQLVHVRDLARALVASAVTAGAGGIYHVAEPRDYAWAEVADLIVESVGRPAVRIPVPRWSVWAAAATAEAVTGAMGRASIFSRDKVRELLAPGWLCTTERAREQLGWEARYSLREGLRQTVEWYREHDQL